MGLMNKLKDILFDEETVEIPVITKEVEETYRKDTAKKQEVVKDNTLNNTRNDVVVTKVSGDDDYMFDMPKLKEEADKEIHKNTFTFPIFNDDELDLGDSKRVNKKNNYEDDEILPSKKKAKHNLYNDNYYKKSDNKLNDDKRRNKDELTKFSSFKKSEDTASERHFQLSPIISPVYGILNEDYKKEDIVTKSESKSSVYEKLDFDSVRKKAYGTLEDEIEDALDKPNLDNDVFDEIPEDNDYFDSELNDDGVSVDELLAPDKDSYDTVIDSNNSTEVKEKTKENKDELGEEDLFDLIDSLYSDKGEN